MLSPDTKDGAQKLPTLPANHDWSLVLLVTVKQEGDLGGGYMQENCSFVGPAV